MTKSFRCDNQTSILLKDLKKFSEELYSVKLNESQIIITAIRELWIKYRVKLLDNQNSNK